MSSASNPDENPNENPNEMLICFCHGVLEAEIRQAIADGATTVEAIQAKTRASTGCGGCRPEVERILEDAAKAASGTAKS